MTIDTSLSRITYNGDGVSTVFPVNFVFFGPQEINVIETIIATGVETTKTIGTHFTVTGGNRNIGTVTAVVPPPNTVKWTIVRNTNKTQLVDYLSNDLFPAETHEEALDRLTAITQELADLIGRTLTLPASATGVSVIFPGPGAGKFFRWNGAGTAIEAVDLTSLGVIGIPVSITQGGTGATNIDDAQLNLRLNTINIYNHYNFI